MTYDTTKYERHLEWIRDLYLGTELMFSELNIPVHVKDGKFVIDKKYASDVILRVSPEYLDSEIVFV